MPENHHHPDNNTGLFFAVVILVLLLIGVLFFFRGGFGVPALAPEEPQIEIPLPEVNGGEQNIQTQ